MSSSHGSFRQPSSPCVHAHSYHAKKEYVQLPAFNARSQWPSPCTETSRALREEQMAAATSTVSLQRRGCSGDGPTHQAMFRFAPPGPHAFSSEYAAKRKSFARPEFNEKAGPPGRPLPNFSWQRSMAAVLRNSAANAAKSPKGGAAGVGLTLLSTFKRKFSKSSISGSRTKSWPTPLHFGTNLASRKRGRAPCQHAPSASGAAAWSLAAAATSG
mmetsp:Transcript_66800/g.186408  ORF Transcript_66800/g.186408 Transcript_66800/m.186408 type:complete len:215 (+) Transcript_66800:111-755(+)